MAAAAPLVLDGPGSELDRFAEHADPDCPPNKRCYPMPAEHSLPALVGIAADGSFVLVRDPDAIALHLHGARAPPRPSPPGQLSLLPT